MTDVIMTAAFGGGRHHQENGLEAVEGLDLALLVDAKHHGPLGWVEVGAHDVSHLLDEVGVGRELEGLARWGWSSEACQIRRVVVWLSPTSAAMSLIDQWVALFGFSSKVFTITDSTWSSVMVRGAPGLGSSDRPSRRRSTNRLRHLPTMASRTPR